MRPITVGRWPRSTRLSKLLDNLCERMNRYFSMSRRSSPFFGSHKGAERAAVLYTISLSARMNHLNLFDYITDILDKTSQWQPNTPLEKIQRVAARPLAAITERLTELSKTNLAQFLSIRECRIAYAVSSFGGCNP